MSLVSIQSAIGSSLKFLITSNWIRQILLIVNNPSMPKRLPYPPPS
jgi:hypothetical protein